MTEQPGERAGEQSLERAEALLQRLREARAELDRLAGADDANRAIELLSELAELAREVEAELTRARRESGADA